MEEIISRAEAKAQDLMKYFTGQPCIFGHITHRWTNSGRCTQCDEDKRNGVNAHINSAQRMQMTGRLANAIRKEREMNAGGEYTEADIQALLVSQNGVCNGCPCSIWDEYTIDHKQPLARGGSHDPSNLQLLCHPCNSSKGTLTMEEWLADSILGSDGRRQRNARPAVRWQCQTPTWAKHREPQQ